jgi:hypothetical protein
LAAAARAADTGAERDALCLLGRRLGLLRAVHRRQGRQPAAGNAPRQTRAAISIARHRAAGGDIAALLDQAGMPLAGVCNNALDRAVGFALDDLQDQGRATQAITGQTQTFFDGSDRSKGFHLAWVTAYLQLPGMTHADKARKTVGSLGALSYSKLGGNQQLIWEKLF